jgi:hypothetical protein
VVSDVCEAMAGSDHRPTAAVLRLATIGTPRVPPGVEKRKVRVTLSGLRFVRASYLSEGSVLETGKGWMHNVSDPRMRWGKFLFAAGGATLVCATGSSAICRWWGR